MPLLRTLVLLLVAGQLAACVGPFRDRSLVYRDAADAPVLALPEGQETRPVRPLFPVPPETGPREWPKKFEVPRPRPLPADVVSQAPVPEAPAGQAGRPVLTQDGNGYPVLSIQGDFNAVWDGLDQSLRAAGVKVEDRDQRLSLYYVRLTDADGRQSTYQLRVTRGQTAFVLALQKDDDTLAPQAMTRTLFESIANRWP